jgi:hypothetical protein
MLTEFLTIRIHKETAPYLNRLCAYKQMQTGERWTMADIIDELLNQYPEQVTDLPKDMFRGAARGKK